MLIPLASLALTWLLPAVTAQFFHTSFIAGEMPSGDASQLLTSNQVTNLDDAKVFQHNGTSYDWWYFDATSQSSDAHVVIVFYGASGGGFAGVTAAETFTPVGFVATYPNGTFVSVNGTLPGSVDGLNATIWTQRNKQGAFGEWAGTGFSFSSQEGLNHYTINIDSEELGIHGSITYHQRGIPHYPCGVLGDAYPDPAYEDLAVIPGVGWANAMPDADVTAHLKIIDQATGDVSAIDFDDGIGYHDKNWGIIPFDVAVQSWFWGHARVGPYSLVWFDSINWDQLETFSAYVSKDGKLVTAGCSDTSVRARPYGNDTGDTFPPTATSNYPEGVEVTFSLPDDDDLVLTFPVGQMVVNAPAYNRYTGHQVTARIGDVYLPYQGTGLWEYLNIAARRAFRERQAEAASNGTVGAYVARGLEF